MSRLRYFAYGSNLHPRRLGARVPSARLVGVAELPGWRLGFGVCGRDGSGKCNITPAGKTDDRVLGALYEMVADERPMLDRCEAGYGVRTVTVMTPAGRTRAFTYVAAPEEGIAPPPFEWYRALVVGGARHLGLSADYVAAIEAVAAAPDPDPERHRRHAAILAETEVAS